MNSCITVNDIDWVNTLLSAIALIIACLGVGAWRQQIKGSYKFEKINKMIIELNKTKQLMFSVSLVLLNENFEIPQRPNPSVEGSNAEEDCYESLKRIDNQIIEQTKIIRTLFWEIQPTLPQIRSVFREPIDTIENFENELKELILEFKESKLSKKEFSNVHFKEFSPSKHVSNSTKINKLITFLSKRMVN